ncbi:MAG: deoxyribodipyrimidine photo-lyase [Ignavibacteriales bacterium]|nr:MAG: deoxyribodipyrimidine photo-lyase [Ignavibacteriales bacterium]
MINEKRVRLLQKGNETNGPVVYWMSRDQRVHDNWALLFSQQIALEKKKPLIVLFNIVPDFLEATIRQYGFMLKGLQEIDSELAKYDIPFFLLAGKPDVQIPEFLKQNKGSVLVSDFDPLKIKRIWKRDVAREIAIPFYEVDAHNIAPCLFVSDKLEFAAYTIRPKIHKALIEFLDEFPSLKKMGKTEIASDEIDWVKIRKLVKINFDIKEVDWLKPGETSALKSFKYFLKNKFENYYELRNDPSIDYQSNLSPYLHFGQISAQRVALETQKFNGNKESEKSFLEELIVRKELSDNFCYFNKNYDSFEGFHQWAKTSLNEHRKDERDFVYTIEQFEHAKTHEDLWNAAQMEMVTTGKMHGYMRMYWAKKILEWTKSPEDALRIAIYLNDKYEIDGRDPNGYAGIAWSIGGVHDRAWFERPVYGKIRYMNRNGAEKKFDIKSYIGKFFG